MDSPDYDADDDHAKYGDDYPNVDGNVNDDEDYDDDTISSKSLSSTPVLKTDVDESNFELAKDTKGDID